MNMLTRAITPLLASVALLAPSHLVAETVRVPQDTKYVVRLDLQAFQSTALGKQLFEAAKAKALEEISDGDGGQPKFQKLIEALGFDPFQEIRGVLIFSSNYEQPEEALVLRVNLGKTTGNLEGVVLGVPGYASTEHGDYVIHTASIDHGRQAFGAIHTGADGNKTVLLSARRDALIGWLDQLDGQSPSDVGQREVDLGLDSKAIATVKILELPKLELEGPPANIAKILTGLDFNLRDDGRDLQAVLSLSADNEQHAEQLRQMAQGLAAMAEFAQSVDPDNEELKAIQAAVRGVKADRDNLTVKIQVNVASDVIAKHLEEMINDK